MVSPTPAPPEALPLAGWLSRLIRILRIAEQGVLVLVEGPRERLGELVRAVSAEAPEMDVLTRAPRLAELTPASTVVLCLRPEDFDWLTGARPAVLGHRVALFGDAEVVTALSQQAFDFFDWISHRIEAPAGPPSFAVERLVSAMRRRPRVIAWTGGDLDATFAAARPEQRLMRVPATLAYPELVNRMRPVSRTWVALTEMQDALSRRRARWAAAEAGRAGRTMLVEAPEVPEGAARVGARVLPLELAESMLREAGVTHPARAAALLDLEPEAIERACHKPAEGETPATGRGELRATEGLAAERGEHGEAWLKRLPPWDQAVEEALAAGDHAVAERWITLWQEASPEDPHALLALALLQALRERADLAAATVEQARRLAGMQDDRLQLQILRVNAVVAAGTGDQVKCIALVDEALALARARKRPAQEQMWFFWQRIAALCQLGRMKEAALSLRQAASLATGSHAADLLAEAEAIVTLYSGDAETTIRLLSIREAKGAPAPDVLTQLLSRALLMRGRAQEAEALTRRAIESAERRGAPTAALRAEHASSLLQLGRYDESISELRRLLDDPISPWNAATARTELARCLAALGRHEEAKRELAAALAYFNSAPAPDTAAFARALYARALLESESGDHAAAEALLRQALALEEKGLGKHHPTLIDTLAALGTVLVHQDRPREAEILAKRALRLAETAHQQAGRVAALELLALAQSRMGHAHADDTLRRALEARREVGGIPLGPGSATPGAPGGSSEARASAGTARSRTRRRRRG